MYDAGMVDLHAVRPDEVHGALSSTGHGSSVTVGAWCQCGWAGPRRVWQPGAERAERADLDGHLAVTGHTSFPDGVPGPDGLHVACGHFHDLQDDCPAPADSPRGRLNRAMQPVLNDRTAAIDRLAAIDELRTWLDEQEAMAVIGARMARATWAEMGAAVGTSRQGAHNRWGATVKRYEQAGFLDPDPAPDPASGLPSHPPAR